MRHIRLSLGLPATAKSRHADNDGDDNDAISSEDLRRALARLDPHRSGRLPLGKIKAALQGLGLGVGRVPRASWLELTER